MGRVATYGDVAARAGRPRAWRAVGSIMATCREPGVPCHRVIASGGRLGGYGGSEALKKSLLQAEGLIVTNGRVRRFADVRWSTRRESAPPKRTRSIRGPEAPPKRDRSIRDSGPEAPPKRTRSIRDSGPEASPKRDAIHPRQRAGGPAETGPIHPRRRAT